MGWFERRLVASAGLGSLAFALGFAITYALEGGRLDGGNGALTVECLRGDVGYGPYDLAPSQYPDPLTFATWQFHSLHGADLAAGCPGIGGLTRPLPRVWMAMVPLAIVMGAGFLLVRVYGPTTPRRAFLAGPAITLGYFPMALVSLEFDDWTGTGPRMMYEAAIDGGLLMTGFLYPIVLGGIGGILALAFWDEVEPPPET